MKKIIIGFMCGAALLSGCSDDVLDTQPNDRYEESNFWQTEKQAEVGLNGCYQVLTANGLFGYATPLWEETATPNAWNYDNSAGFNQIASGTHSATSAGTGGIVGGVIANRYSDCYRGIGRCNNFLAHIDGIPMADALKARMKAEAQFLRGLYYSILTTYYGAVPLILDAPDPATQSSLPRTARNLVVQQVIKDLDEAAAVLPPKYTAPAEKGRATKGAALGIKARVLLFEASPLNNPTNDINKWTAAADAAKAVMDLAGEAGYDLFPDYRKLFLPQNEGSQETVFDVQYTAILPGYGNSFDLINVFYNTNAPLRNLIDAYYMKDGLPPALSPLYNSASPYQNRDPRMYQTIVYPGDTFNGEVTTVTTPFKQTGYGVRKYSIVDREKQPVNNQANRSEVNYMLIRYADILLMYAEAKNETLIAPDATVRAAVERVRQRAGLTPYQISTTITKEQMRDLIRQERRIELAMEGFYYNDIRRWKTAETVMNGAIYNSRIQKITDRSFNPARDYWWPIPHTQRELNTNLTQNDLY